MTVSRWGLKLRAVGQELLDYRNIRYSEAELELLILFVTNRCNLRCAHCFYTEELDKPSEEISLDRVRMLFQTLPPIRSQVILTGGECFLHSRFSELIRAVHDSPATRQILIITNGFLTNRVEEICHDLVEWNRKSVTVMVSVDGLEKTHDSIRNRKGSFSRAVKTLEALKDLTRAKPGEFSPTAMMTINDRNYREIGAVADFLWETLRIPVSFELIRGSDFSAWNVPDEMLEKGYSPPGVGLPPREVWNTIREEVREINTRLGYPYHHFGPHIGAQMRMLQTEKPVVRCIAPKGLTPVIYANGDVSVCEFSRPFANLDEYGDDFRGLWDSIRCHQARELMSSCFCTHTCFLVPSMKRTLGQNLKLLSTL